MSWLGTRAGMENRLVPPSGIPLDTIAFSGLRGKGLMHTLTGGLRLLGAFWSCLRIIRRRHTSAVLGMGGYVSFPGGMMASFFNRPLAIHEQNSVAGLANRILRNMGEAEDVAQDAFLQVWAQRHRWQDGGARFGTWLYRVVVNRCIDHKRRPVNGAIDLSDDVPGLGITIKEDALKNFTVIE